MTKNKKNYYAVVRGEKPGLYKTWPEAEKQIKNFHGAKYKGFFDLEDALDYLEENGVHVPEHDARPEKQKDDDYVFIYTDGSAIGNPGPGGYGVVLTFQGKRKELSAGFKETTNNRMELMACIAGLKALKKASKVKIFSDSKYLVDGIEKGWAQQWRMNGWLKSDKKPVENADLWRQLLEALNGHQVEFVWVKGHAGKKENERCDRLANEAAQSSHAAIDEGFKKNNNLSLF